MVLSDSSAAVTIVILGKMCSKEVCKHGVYTSTGGLLSVFMLLEQLFKVAPCRLVRGSAGMLSF